MTEAGGKVARLDGSAYAPSSDASGLLAACNPGIWDDLQRLLKNADDKPKGASVFAYHVHDPERYGVVKFDAKGTVEQIIEKPEVPPSNFAVTGLYFLDGTAPERAKAIRPSLRGELEIVDLLETYLAQGTLSVQKMGRGFAWLDTGTHASLLDAGNFVRTLEARQGLQVGCPDEIAFRAGWIDSAALSARAALFRKNDYGRYLVSVLNDKD